MRYLCVHGHFYQPPRENPSLEAIELQDSAYPYHDWNEKITAECYAPNAMSRILDGQQRIVKLINNYAQISFNFGPTLLSWMESKSPKVYQALRDADKASAQRFSGHGSALAQAYNHMILPLANARDQIAQVKWGIRDFEHRFGRFPEGMWLPETAVDTATLEVLAAQGIQFTILAPRQAKRVRKRGSRSWHDVSGGRVDPSRAYLVRLPSKRNISVFFYDGPISQGVAFERLLDNGQRFADRLLSGFSDARQWPQLVHIATDGESYGHHHHFGDMALSYALHHIETSKIAELTNYGEFLSRFPADHFAEIVENSSWSCIHGVERWRSNCGCNSGGRAGWNQEWRGPLRAALDWLRDCLAPLYEEKTAPLLKDPWLARDAYIRVILDRSEENLRKYLAEHAARTLEPCEQTTALRLLEMQRHAMLMYTSCGWFFDELSGLESVQVLQYAGRAVHLAQEVFGDHIEGQFLERLALAKSNVPEHVDGKRIYEKWVKPAFISTDEVAAHYAISSLFENYGERTQIYCYDVQRQDYSVEVEGKQKLAVGRAQFSSEITRESASLSFGVLHLGDHNIAAGVSRFQNRDEYDNLKKTLTNAFTLADTTRAVQTLNEAFSNNIYSLRTLFRDEQRKIVETILNDSLATVSVAYRNIYENLAPLIRFLHGLNIPIPAAFQAAAEIALNNQLKQAFQQQELDTDTIQSHLKEASVSNIKLDAPGLEYAIRKRLETEANGFASDPALEVALKFRKLLDFVATLPFSVELWEVQNISYAPLIKKMEDLRPEAEKGNQAVKPLLNELALLRERLRIEGR
jgi:alpha-amylase/alpha-mannosidase (GH57 family)